MTPNDQPDSMTQAEALAKCRDQFQFYADEHRRAGKDEKAATNQRFADLCATVLSSPTPTSANNALREAAQAVLDHRFSTYRARNGREVGIQGDDGEKVWLVHSDQMFDLGQALASSPAADPVAGISVADEWSAYMDEAVSKAPKPLRQLGEYLAGLLDEDRWKTAERYLNAAALAQLEASNGKGEG
ncbi:MAG: hypothetical protein AB7E60_05350 [Sphingobium sp.]